MQRTSYYIINGITVYRIVASILLLYFIISDKPNFFKWFLAVSFFTDAIDGFLARRYHVVSAMGAKIDSIGDDLTVLMGVIGLFVFKWDFISSQYVWLIAIFMLFLIQVISAFIRYGALTSFHTYLAKFAAVVQGTFLILAFFLKEPLHTLYYLAIAVTALDLLEEIAITWFLPENKENVKGLYWLVKQRRALVFLPFIAVSIV
ncbi:CDP-alcohol phosphatidyltransferase family protein [Terrimonas pollutisoli]|uniref:CDP-alcohol phosphatidyltransferase family protein n=1 Tax=Terrimonas pollutisoli TaxID=3034147 RepID=UPI0023EDC783|nr:CDP-alcohol phosphatidyltransferase family protein [Terrimonas sp. H1YJ31]